MCIRDREGLDAAWRAMREGGKDGVDGFARRARGDAGTRGGGDETAAYDVAVCAVGRWGCSWRARCRDEGRGWW